MDGAQLKTRCDDLRLNGSNINFRHRPGQGRPGLVPAEQGEISGGAGDK